MAIGCLETHNALSRHYPGRRQGGHQPNSIDLIYTREQRGGAGSEVWNRVYMIAPVKKFGRVRLSTNFPSKQIWRKMQTLKDDVFLLGFKFYGVRKGF